ncbi:MAG TPA: hypothetical protein VN764_13050, partial [Polyangiaceae bacterium]|nr:hypothetical protein [Polyangiaceae bacterium]
RDTKIPIRDAVAAYRAVLCRDRGQHGAVSATLKTARSNLAVRIYPYTKGPDLSNDGLGYGERIRELNRVGERLQRKPRISIVTRSGRSVEISSTLPLPPVHPAPLGEDPTTYSEGGVEEGELGNSTFISGVGQITEEETAG